MKRLLSLILVICIVFSVSLAFADKHLSAHYSVFVDGDFYNSFYKAGFDFDTQMYDFYLYDDFSGGLFCKEEWYKGQRINYGLQEVKYQKTDSGFSLFFSDGSSSSGYWDENDEDLWLDLGGAYFRFCPVHSFDIQKDMISK